MSIFFYVLLLLSVSSIANTKPSTRIVGGEDSYLSQHPYLVSMRKRGSHSCGGTIISPTVILTALHCTDGTDVSDITIRAGSNNRLSGGVIRNVIRKIEHESYKDFLNDVGLLFLDKPLVYSNNIQPIALASKPTPGRVPITLCGWGRLEDGGDLPQTMQTINLSTMDSNQCSNILGMNTESLVCIEHTEGYGACNGDSGGAAIYDNEVVGITGFVVGGCGYIYPDGYASVYYHRDWILKNAGL